MVGKRVRTRREQQQEPRNNKQEEKRKRPNKKNKKKEGISRLKGQRKREQALETERRGTLRNKQKYRKESTKIVVRTSKGTREVTPVKRKTPGIPMRQGKP